MKDPKRLLAWSWEDWRERKPACIELDTALEAAVGEERGGGQWPGRWSNGPLPLPSSTAYAAGSACAESPPPPQALAETEHAKEMYLDRNF